MHLLIAEAFEQASNMYKFKNKELYMTRAEFNAAVVNDTGISRRWKEIKRARFFILMYIIDVMDNMNFDVTLEDIKQYLSIPEGSEQWDGQFYLAKARNQ